MGKKIKDLKNIVEPQKKVALNEDENKPERVFGLQVRCRDLDNSRTTSKIDSIIFL